MPLKVRGSGRFRVRVMPRKVAVWLGGMVRVMLLKVRVIIRIRIRVRKF